VLGDADKAYIGRRGVHTALMTPGDVSRVICI
jgi:hypothetical protein